MAGIYNNGFPATYQPYIQQYQPQQDQRAIHGFDWVLGAEGANAYNVPLGKTFILFDASPNSNHFFLKSTDATGRPMPAVMFDYEQHKVEAGQDMYVPVAQFEALKKELDEIKSKPTPATLTAEDVRDLFDQMMEQRFSAKGKKADA